MIRIMLVIVKWIKMILKFGIILLMRNRIVVIILMIKINVQKTEKLFLN